MDALPLLSRHAIPRKLQPSNMEECGVHWRFLGFFPAYGIMIELHQPLCTAVVEL